MSEPEEPPMSFRDFLELLIRLDEEGRHQERDSLVAQFVGRAPTWQIVFSKMQLSEVYLEKGQFRKAIIAKNRAKALWMSAKAMGVDTETEQMVAAAIVLRRHEDVLVEAVPEELKEECRAEVDDDLMRKALGINFDPQVRENGNTRLGRGSEMAPDGGLQSDEPTCT